MMLIFWREKILALDIVYVTVYEHFKKNLHLNVVLQIRSLEKTTINRKLMICWQNVRTVLIYQRYTRGFFCERKEWKGWWENTSIFVALTSNNKVKILASILLLKTSPSNKTHKNTNDILLLLLDKKASKQAHETAFKTESIFHNPFCSWLQREIEKDIDKNITLIY